MDLKMNEEDLRNSVSLTVKIDDDGSIITIATDALTDDIDPEVREYMLYMLSGLQALFEATADAFAQVGYLIKCNADLQENSAVSFEPSEDLIASINDGKIIPFNKKKLN
jgi:hypothetical protein